MPFSPGRAAVQSSQSRQFPVAPIQAYPPVSGAQFGAFQPEMAGQQVASSSHQPPYGVSAFPGPMPSPQSSLPPNHSSEKDPIVRSQSAPVEEEEKGILEQTSEVIGTLYHYGKQLVTSKALTKPEDDQTKSVRDRLEECSGLRGDYKTWFCPACTLENPSEFYDCEACTQENSTLKALMKAIGRPCEKRGKKGWF